MTISFSGAGVSPAGEWASCPRYGRHYHYFLQSSVALALTLFPQGRASPSFALASCDPCSSMLIRGLFLTSRKRHAEPHRQGHLAIQAAQSQSGIVHPKVSIVSQAPTVRSAGVGSIFRNARCGHLAAKISGQLRPCGRHTVAVRGIVVCRRANRSIGSRGKANFERSAIALVMFVRAANRDLRAPTECSVTVMSRSRRPSRRACATISHSPAPLCDHPHTTHSEPPAPPFLPAFLRSHFSNRSNMPLIVHRS